MEEVTLNFEEQTFMEKEAASFNPQMWRNTLKKMNPAPLIQGLRRKVPAAPAGNPPTKGRFTLDPSDAAINPENVRMYNGDEVAKKVDEELKRESTGGFTLDGLLGLTKKIIPATKEPIENAVLNTKKFTEKWDTKAGQVLAGKNADSFRGKFFSTNTMRNVGEEVHSDGTAEELLKSRRRPSAIAAIENPVKFATPFLGAAYVGEKLYPQENVGQGVNQTTYDQSLTKQSATLVEPLFENSVIDELDKQASIQKIAELEDHLSKYASRLLEIEMEKNAAERQLEETQKEKDHLEKRASAAESNLMEKEAEYEELRLRTIAQRRSKVAVDLAEEMLGCGLIKQAEVERTIDELMECDERTIKMYQKLASDSKTQEESLESLAFLGEYKGNDKLATMPKDLASHGLSRSGQSIGEAARDLNIK